MKPQLGKCKTIIGSILSRKWNWGCTHRRDFSTVNEKLIKIEDKHINYLQKGHGPNVLLCLPGALGTIWSDFKPQIEGFDPKKFTIVVWDPPGYGKSRPPEKSFDTDLFKTDARIADSLMQELGFDSYSPLGWSDGGNTALVMAASYPRVKKLVIWGANSFFTKDDIDIFEGIRDTSKWSKRMREPLLKEYGEEGLQRMMSSLCDVYVSFERDLGGELCREKLKNISVPTFVLHGAKDPLVRDEHPKVIHKEISKSRLYIFEEGKHNIHLRYAQEFNKLLMDFLID